ncbi:hypothetical protein [Pseudonocardia sp. KRD291]|uniref:hypothetical protein n=1 Tax=Pseudonocardia sp. KRD291 TaxID=2792007 RepID=UPI001C49D1CA|nr:hypothetical protein [Pseudonocardia sp. KRD291]MBW0105730.1 hypothetical protein [Pseudonocardia sp. KRD291]
MDGFLPPPGTPTLAESRIPWWHHVVSLLAMLSCIYAGLSLPSLALAAAGRVGPVSEVSAVVGEPRFEQTSSRSIRKLRQMTTARFADGNRIVLGPVSDVRLMQGTEITLTSSEWTGYPVRVEGGSQRIELLPGRFGPLWLTVLAQAVAGALLVAVRRVRGAGWVLIVALALALGCMIGMYTVAHDATPRADGSDALHSPAS